jgi:hypothetical protein
MPLTPLPPDPEPTEEEIAARSPPFEGFPEQLRPSMARLQWIADMERLQPDLFLVPYVKDASAYDAYRNSSQWKAIRQNVLRKANHKCEACGLRANQVHHRDYRPRVLSGEDVRPLVAICSRCHEAIEKIRKEVSWQEGERLLAKLVGQRNDYSEEGKAQALVTE